MYIRTSSPGSGIWHHFTSYTAGKHRYRLRCPRPSTSWTGGLSVSRCPSPAMSLHHMDTYDTVAACRDVLAFWIIFPLGILRRSRIRLREDMKAMEVYGWVLTTLVTVMAPMTPFISEQMYQNLMNTGDSIHHKDWPIAGQRRATRDMSWKKRCNLSAIVCASGHAQRKNSFSSGPATGPESANNK